MTPAASGTGRHRPAGARRTYGLVLALTVATLAAGCTDGAAVEPPRDDTADVAAAVVTRGTITSVVTLAATVVAAPPVIITAPAAGTAQPTIGDRIPFTTVDGTSSDIVLSGVSVIRDLAPAGRRVPANLPLAEGRVDGFAVVAQVEQAALFRLYAPPTSARAQIVNGPGPFPCTLVNRVPAFGEASGTEQADGLTITCVPPPDTLMFAGMPAILALTVAEVPDALTLPIEAVAGSAQNGTVLLLLSDGRTESRVVGLGQSDGARIQVTRGLTDGDRVRVPGPDLAEVPVP